MIRTVLGAGSLTISTAAGGGGASSNAAIGAQGVWMPRAPVGKAQCARCLAAERAGDADRASTALGGATIICGQLRPQLRRIWRRQLRRDQGRDRRSQGHWTARVLVGFDSHARRGRMVRMARMIWYCAVIRLSLTQEVDKNRSGPLAFRRCAARVPAAHGADRRRALGQPVRHHTRG